MKWDLRIDQVFMVAFFASLFTPAADEFAALVAVPHTMGGDIIMVFAKFAATLVGMGTFWLFSAVASKLGQAYKTPNQV